MALLALSDDALGVIFEGLRNTLDPRVLVVSSSTCKGLRALTQPLVQRLRADYEEATALCLKLGKRSCKELREAKVVDWRCTGFSAADLALLGRLVAVLPALERLVLIEFSGSADPDGVSQLTEGLIAGALPAVKHFILAGVPVGDASPPPWTKAPCRGSNSSLWATPPSATRHWRPSRRPCGGIPLCSVSTSGRTRSATRASPPSWRRRRLQARRRCLLEG